MKKFKSDLIQLFVKNVLSASGRVPDHVHAWAKPILALATHEEFSGKILAQVNRGLLRNPETCIETVANLLKSELTYCACFMCCIGNLCCIGQPIRFSMLKGTF